MHTVLITAPTIAACGAAMLKNSDCHILYCKDEAEMGELLAMEKIDAVISRTLPLSGVAIASCPSLKVISKHGAGYNNIDVEAATRLGIPVFHTPGANSQPVAELALGLMIAVARTITLHDRSLRAGGWSRSETGQQLSGRSLGVVGLGNIGQKVARLGAAFGMRVVGYDPYVRTSPCERVESLHALLPQAEILSLHCPLTKETAGMIGPRELSMLPRHAILINTARSFIVDETALAEAVASRHLFGAGLDDFMAEPIAAEHPFNKLSHIVMTPHIGTPTREALDAIAAMAAENVLAFLDHHPLDSARCVNPATLARKKAVSA